MRIVYLVEQFNKANNAEIRLKVFDELILESAGYWYKRIDKLRQKNSDTNNLIEFYGPYDILFYACEVIKQKIASEHLTRFTNFNGYVAVFIDNTVKNLGRSQQFKHSDFATMSYAPMGNLIDIADEHADGITTIYMPSDREGYGEKGKQYEHLHNSLNKLFSLLDEGELVRCKNLLNYVMKQITLLKKEDDKTYFLGLSYLFLSDYHFEQGKLNLSYKYSNMAASILR